MKRTAAIAAFVLFLMMFAALVNEALAQVINPLVITSEVEPQGDFTVALTFQRTTAPVCFMVPAGHYSKVWTLIVPFEDVSARGWLNLYRSNPNAAAPLTRGLQISQRFELFRADSSGDMWRVSDTSFDGPAELCASAGSSPDVGMVWQARLVGKAFGVI